MTSYTKTAPRRNIEMPLDGNLPQARLHIDPPRTRGGQVLQRLTGRPSATCDCLALLTGFGCTTAEG